MISPRFERRSARPSLAAVIAVGWLTAASGLSAAPTYPVTRTVPVTDAYHGRIAADPYRWLEDGSAPDVEAWTAAQRAIATNALRSSPAYAAIKARVTALSRTSTSRYDLTIAGGRLFYERRTPTQEQPQLVVRDGIAGPERVPFDPSLAAPAGAPQPAIETIAVEPDGARVAFTTQVADFEDETSEAAPATASAAPARSASRTSATSTRSSRSSYVSADASSRGPEV